LQVAIDCLKIPDRACRLGKAALISANCEDFIEFFSNNLLMRISDITLGTVRLEDILRQRIIECLSRLDEEEKQFLLGRIQFAANRQIKSTSELREIGIDVIMGALGSRGKVFLEEICSDPRARKQIVDAVPNELCSKLNKELSDIAKKCEFPTIKLPNWFPTIDIIASISISIEVAITDAILVALIELIKSILEQILNCEDGFKTPDFGQFNLTDMLARTFDIGIDTDSFFSLQTNTMKMISLGTLGAEYSINSLIGLTNDVGALISPSEMANLLNGDIDPDVMALINCLIDTKYPGLRSALNSSAKIDDFYKGFGDVLDKKQLLEQIAQLNRPEILSSDDVCAIPEDLNFRRLLENKGLTPEEINRQVEMATKRKEDLFDGFLNNLLKGNPLEDALPPIFCTINSNGKEEGIIKGHHPSFTYMMDKTIDVIYDGVYMTFNNEISNFTNALRETTAVQIPRAIERKINVEGVTEDGKTFKEEVENPEFRRLISQGVSVKEPEDLDKEAVIVYEDMQFTTGFAARGLKENLKNIQLNQRLFNVDVRGNVSFVIPNMIDVNKLSSATLLKNINSVTKDPTLLKTINNFKNVKDVANISEYYIQYRPSNLLKEGKDEYSIDIQKFDVSDNKIVETEVAVATVDEIKPEVLNFIQSRKLEHDVPQRSVFEPEMESSLPQSYFGSFITKVWKEGAPIYINGISVSKPHYAVGVAAEKLLNKIDTKLKNEFKTIAYKNLFVDTFASFAEQVSKSPLFNLKVLSLLDFTPDSISGKCRPHLLNLDDIKMKMRDAMMNNVCVETLFPTTDGLGKQTPNSMEREGINGAIRTLVRLITIENILRTIFVFSEFKINISEDIDSTIVNYIANKIYKELLNIGEITKDDKFAQQFAEQTLLSYNVAAETGEIEADKTDNFEIAARYYINIEIKSVVEQIASLAKKTDGTNQLELDRILISDYLPLFDTDRAILSEAAGPRFVKSETKKSLQIRDFKQTEIEETLAQNIRNAESLSGRVNFSFDNGNFILERYVRVSYKNEEDRFNRLLNAVVATTDQQATLLSESRKIKRGQFGVLRLKDFEQVLKTIILPETIVNGTKLEDIIESLHFGLRLVYVPPLNEEKLFGTLSSVESVSREILKDTESNKIKINNEVDLNKSFIVEESVQTTELVQSSLTFETHQKQRTREVYQFPIVCVEIPEDINFLARNTNVPGVITVLWNDKRTRLRESLLATEEYKFIFGYCIPVDRMFSLLSLYNITYLSNLEPVRNLFEGTKIAIKSVFSLLLNSGNYQYSDAYIEQMGGNAGLNTTSINNVDTDPKVPGVNVAAMALRTPILILKGLVELIDPNISRARKIVDIAKANGKNVPIHVASLGQLPMNVFMPYPMGIGIGAPISPLGFIYLALNIDDIFSDAQGKEVKRNDIGAEFGIDFSGFGGKIKCPDKGKK